MIHEETPDTPSSLPKTVLVLGASSLVGDYLLPLLARAGYEVHALSREPQSKNPAPEIQWHIADVDKFQELGALPCCANVISLLPLWKLPFAADILRARGMRRLLAFSSTSALTKADSADPAERALAERLHGAEDALWKLQDTGNASTESGERIALTLFRPTLIYDGSRDRNITRIAGILARIGFFPLPGKGSGLRQPVHAEDLAIAAIQALASPDSHDRCYELGGGETLTYRAMVERIALALPQRPRILSLPSPFFALVRAALFLLRPPSPLSRLFPRLASLSPEALHRINRDMAFDYSSATHDFNYSPRAFHPEFPWHRRARAK